MSVPDGSGRRDLRLLAAGMLVSVAGDAAATVALLLELHTRGAIWIAALLAAELLPFVMFAPISGRLVDRVDNRRLLVAALLGQAVVAVPLALVRAPVAIVALVFVLTAVSTAVRPAASAMVPVLAGDARATSGYAWIATATGIGFIVGPALGGALTAGFGVSLALLADAGSFVVIAIACSCLSATRQPAPAADGTPDRRGGMHVLWHDHVLRWSLLATAATIACAVVDNVAAPFRFLDGLHASATGYGAYLAFWGVGALLGSQLPRRTGPAGMPVALAIGNALSGAGIAGIGLAPGLAVAFAASVAGGVGNGIANVSLSALVTSRVPGHERGRAFAATGAVVQTGTGAGTIAAAPLVESLHAAHAMVAAGSIAFALAAITAIWSVVARPSRGEQRAHVPCPPPGPRADRALHGEAP